MHRIKSAAENLDLSGFFSAEPSTSSPALALGFLLSVNPFTASGAVFLPVGVRRKSRPTLGTVISTLLENVRIQFLFGG